MPRAPLRQVIRYRFDTFMTRGGASVFVSLLVVFLGLIVLIGLARMCLHWIWPELFIERGGDNGSGLYMTFLQLTDPGNMVQDLDSSPFYKFTAILAGMAGVVMLSALIALITNALDRKVEELRRGHSKVIEAGHTLILGWNEQRVIEIIRELVIANESERDACVVILSDHDKEAMDHALRLNLKNNLATTRLVTRSGSPSSLPNLEVVSVRDAKSVIVLAQSSAGDSNEAKASSDAAAIQMLLAVTSMRPSDDEGAIVAEIFSSVFRAVVDDVFAGNVVPIDSADILAKILVQTSRSVGLSTVYNEISPSTVANSISITIPSAGSLFVRWPSTSRMASRLPFATAWGCSPSIPTPSRW